MTHRLRSFSRRQARHTTRLLALATLVGSTFIALPASAQIVAAPAPVPQLQTPQQASESAINKAADAGRFEEALAKADDHLKQYPRDAQVRFTRARVLMQMDRRPEAIDAFTALTQDFPELPEPYNNLAALYAQAGEYDKARAALESAIRNNPRFAVAYANLGDIYARLAQLSYQQALKIAPTARVSAREKTLAGMLGTNRPTQAPAAAPAKKPDTNNLGKTGN